MAEWRVGEPLSEEVLSRRAALPRRVAPVTLRGSRVTLAPLDLKRDVEALHEASDGRPLSLGGREVAAYDPELLIWRYLSAGPFESAAALGAWLRLQVEAEDGLCLCVSDAATGRPVGVANFMSNAPEHLKIELGNIWYGPIAQGAKANVEATCLMLEHAFALGYRRVEWKCNSLNERSRRAALAMGFRFEGVQESHYIFKGRNRDTAWYRMLDREWPEARSGLRRALA
jgi:RimJ/RimL family protein N-acetyltransferase